MTLTGDLIDGVKAADWGLVSESAVEWRDSGRPIPEGDEARKAIAELEAQIAESLGSKDARI
jgi:enoyl-CoA hydratase/carnithine racemase